MYIKLLTCWNHCLLGVKVCIQRHPTPFGQSIVEQGYVFLQFISVLGDTQLIGKCQCVVFRTLGQTRFQQVRDRRIHNFFPALKEKNISKLNGKHALYSGKECTKKIKQKKLKEKV